MKTIPDALHALTGYKQWVLWKLIDGKKLPFNPHTLTMASSTDPTHWGDAQTVVTSAALFGDEYGVGFVFTDNDPFYFVDIDHCAIDGEWSPLATTVLSMLPGAAVEVSQSGEGLHIIGKGVVPEHACKNVKLGLELYHTERFVALTGNGALGDANTEAGQSLNSLVNQYFPAKTVATGITWTTEPCNEWNGYEDDEALIARAIKSKSAASTFGTTSTFKALWERDVEKLNISFTPDNSDSGEYDESSADAALVQHLAFWTGGNCERIKKLMFMSGLVRDKWQREAYINNTITRITSMQTQFHQLKRKEPPRVSVDPTVTVDTVGPVMTEGYQFLGITQQIEYFKGCCYVQDVHKIFTPGGEMIKTEQFNATYGGYVFQLEADSTGKTTRKAWEAFTESQGVRYPQAKTTCFRPTIAPGAIIHEESRELVNTYIPIHTRAIQGDASPFLNHMAKLLPDERDCEILMCYMAAVVQHKGVKFKWCPLIQGTEGNGKTLFTEVLAQAIGRRYTHLPRAADIDNKFNSWIYGKLFIGIEDIFVADHKREVMEALKPLITGEHQDVQGKGQDQITKEVCANLILNCNVDTIKRTIDNRRFAMFYTAQQSFDDIKRDGMTGNYFPDLYDWLKGRNKYSAQGENYGYAIVNNYLQEYVINPKFNPATDCQRAPDTSTTAQAIEAGLGSIEQEIMEAIDEGRVGFANGWISSMALDRMLDNLRMTRAIPRNKRKVLLESLGYEWHPGLHDGRASRIVNIDGGKPRLFIKKGHLSSNLIGGGVIVKAYSDAQVNHSNTTATEAFGENHG